MIKFGLLKYSNGNVGDEIQSIAAKRFLPKIDCYIDRDFFNEFKSRDRTKVLVHGWFTHNPENWPPLNENLEPLFISFHISNLWGSSEKKMTDSNSIKYYKKFEPIGCRDYHTLSLLRKKGVDSYFSGCITLSLSNPIKSRNDQIYFVEVDDRLIKMVPKRVRDKIKFLSHVGVLYQTHRKEVFRSFLRSRLVRRKYVEYRFKKAQGFLDLYAQAKLVVTTRLHCALPCLAFGTPVLFIAKDLNDPRLDGLLDLLNFCSIDEIKNGNLKINWDDPEPNPVDIAPLRKDIIKRCEKFINK